MQHFGKSVATIALVLVASTAQAEPYRRLSIDDAMVRWQSGGPDDPVVLRYALASRDVETAGARNCARIKPLSDLLRRSQLSAADIRRATSEAFSWWQRQVNISFVEVDDLARADIVIGEQADPTGFAFTNVVVDTTSTDDGPPHRIASAQICLNPHQPWKIGFDGNLAIYDLVHTIAHEIGHAIGLDHPTERGHLMSFRYHETRAGLSDGDLQGAAAIYGYRAAPLTAALAGRQNVIAD